MDVLSELTFFKPKVLQTLHIGLINCQYLVDRDLLTKYSWCKTGELQVLKSGSNVYMYNNYTKYMKMDKRGEMFLKRIEGISIIYHANQEICLINYNKSRLMHDIPSIKTSKKITVSVFKRFNLFFTGFTTAYFIYKDRKYFAPRFIHNGPVTGNADDIITDIPEDVEEDAVWFINEKNYAVGSLIPYKPKMVTHTTTNMEIIYKELINVPHIPLTHVTLSDILFRPKKLCNYYKDIITINTS